MMIPELSLCFALSGFGFHVFSCMEIETPLEHLTFQFDKNVALMRVHKSKS